MKNKFLLMQNKALIVTTGIVSCANPDIHMIEVIKRKCHMKSFNC